MAPALLGGNNSSWLHIALWAPHANYTSCQWWPSKRGEEDDEGMILNLM